MNRIMALCFGIMLSLSLIAQPGKDITATGESLIGLAKKIRPDFYIGSFFIGLNPHGAENDPSVAIFKNNFNIITAGIYMQVTQREQEKYNLQFVDDLVEFSNANKMKVYLHPLFGGAQYCSDWLRKGTFTKEEIEQIMRDRVTSILGRYMGRIHYVDVVNESLQGGDMTPDGQFDWRLEDTWIKDGTGANPWMKLGMYQGRKYRFPQYLVEAFRLSREIGGKDLELILNEHDNSTTKSHHGNNFLLLIKAMREEGIPVDGAGMQLHLRMKEGKIYEWDESINTIFDFDAFEAMLKQYEGAGINVHITEFDIHLPENATEADFQLQGKCYAEVLKRAIQSPAVKTFKTWGFTDKNAWKPYKWNSYPLLLDENFKPKPAYLRQVEMLKSLARGKK